MLYKYLSSDRIDVIENLEIRFTQPPSLNDPFESALRLGFSTDIEKLAKKIDQSLEDNWDRTPPEKQTDRNKEIKENTKVRLKNSLSEMLSPAKMGVDVANRISRNVGILSLSRTDSNLLLWAHYASNHLGYLIGLDRSHPFLSLRVSDGGKTQARKITYTTQRNIFSSSDPDYHEKLFCEKSIDWAYEEEERVFRSLEDLDSRGRIDSFGNKIHLFDLPNDLIQRVVIGARMKLDDERRIIAAISKNGINCLVQKARISLTEFKVEFIDL